MKTCQHCHSEIEDNRTTCPFCGGSQATYQQNTNTQNGNPYQQQYQQYQQNNSYQEPYQNQNKYSVNDSGSIGWWFLGFLFPIVGLILYFVWRGDKPFTAKRCLWGALISWISSFVFAIINAICMIIGITSGMF